MLYRLPADRLLLPWTAVQQISQQLLHLCVVQATSGQVPLSLDSCSTNIPTTITSLCCTGYQRTGSTFLGQLFNKYPNNYYIFVLCRLPADRLLLPWTAVQQISQQLLHLCVVQATSDRFLFPWTAVQQISQQLLHLCVVQATSGQVPLSLDSCSTNIPTTITSLSQWMGYILPCMEQNQAGHWHRIFRRTGMGQDGK